MRCPKPHRGHVSCMDSDGNSYPLWNSNKLLSSQIHAHVLAYTYTNIIHAVWPRSDTSRVLPLWCQLRTHHGTPAGYYPCDAQCTHHGTSPLKLKVWMPCFINSGPDLLSQDGLTYCTGNAMYIASLSNMHNYNMCMYMCMYLCRLLRQRYLQF